MQRLWPKEISADRKAWESLLQAQGIRSEENLDATYGLYEGETLIATASHFQNIIKCVAIADGYKGGAVFNSLLSDLLQELYRLGYTATYVYTKPEAERAFRALGFQKIESVADQLVFLEKARPGFADFLKDLAKEKRPGQAIGAIVLNANPLTKGHLQLIQAAHAASSFLHLFLVREDLSVFPYAIRRKLLEKSTKHLPHLAIHQTGPYLVSAQTFPSYFLKEASEVGKVQATLDARIFKYHFAPVLGITERFVGEEPLSPTTALYNQVMAEVFQTGLPKLTLTILPRFRQDQEVISASKVRQLLAQGKLEEASTLVPQPVADFFQTEEARPILEELKADPRQGRKKADA